MMTFDGMIAKDSISSVWLNQGWFGGKVAAKWRQKHRGLMRQKHGFSTSAVMKKISAETWGVERKKRGSKIEAKVKQNPLFLMVAKWSQKYRKSTAKSRHSSL